MNQIIVMLDSSVASASSVTTSINDASVPVPNNSQEVNVVSSSNDKFVVSSPVLEENKSSHRPVELVPERLSTSLQTPCAWPIF